VSIFIRMLKEGIVDIPPQEEKAIDGFVKELERFHKKRSSIHKDQSNNAICYALKEYANTVLAPKYGLTQIYWRFIYEPNSENKAGYIPTHDEIFVNLAYNVSNVKDGLQSQKIDWHGVAASIYHEWVHLKQDIRLKMDHPRGMSAFQKMYRSTAYSDIKWEQMAMARQEVEWIKRNIKRVKPEHVLKWLQRQGLRGPDMQILNKTNPEAYKRILKYAVMFMLKKLAQKSTKK